MYTDHCSERVLTMEYMEGGQVNDDKYLKDHNIDYEQVSRLLVFIKISMFSIVF